MYYGYFTIKSNLIKKIGFCQSSLYSDWFIHFKDKTLMYFLSNRYDTKNNIHNRAKIPLTV